MNLCHRLPSTSAITFTSNFVGDTAKPNDAKAGIVCEYLDTSSGPCEKATNILPTNLITSNFAAHVTQSTIALQPRGQTSGTTASKLGVADTKAMARTSCESAATIFAAYSATTKFLFRKYLNPTEPTCRTPDHHNAFLAYLDTPALCHTDRINNSCAKLLRKPKLSPLRAFMHLTFFMLRSY